MPRGKGKKNPFDALPEDFKNAIEGASAQQLSDRLSDIAKSDELNLAAAKADEDLQNAKDQVKVCSESYREVAKMNKLKRKYIIQSMSDSGDDVAQKIVQMDLASK
jgi:hypothetical protein